METIPKLKNVIKAWQEASKESKSIIETIFPDINNQINPERHKNVIFEATNKGRKYMYVLSNECVKYTFEIPDKYLLTYKKVKIKHLPVEFLEKINYFK